MNDFDVPAYARLPNGPHEPNVTPKGVMLVDKPHKMAKTLMKLASHLHKPKASPRPSRVKRSSTKWY